VHALRVACVPSDCAAAKDPSVMSMVRVKGSSIVEEDAYYLLEEFGFGFVDVLHCVNWIG